MAKAFRAGRISLIGALLCSVLAVLSTTQVAAGAPGQVSATAHATLSAVDLAPGQVIRITGDGWRAGALIKVTLHPGGHRVEVNADGAGNFSTDFDIPADTKTGAFGITIGGGGKDGLFAYLQNAVTITGERPSVELSSTSLNTGDVLVVTGRRWKPGATIQLVLHPVKQKVTVKPEPDGTFAVEIPISGDSKTGDYALTVSGGGADGLNGYLENPLTITAPRPTAKLGDNTLTAGQVIRITGNRWKVGGTVTITLHPGRHTVKVEAGDDTRFSTSFDIPEDLKAGTYGITLAGGGADGLGAYLQNLVTIGLGVPPAPDAVVPEMPAAPDFLPTASTEVAFPKTDEDSPKSSMRLTILLVLGLLVLLFLLLLLLNHPEVKRRRLRLMQRLRG